MDILKIIYAAKLLHNFFLKHMLNMLNVSRYEFLRSVVSVNRHKVCVLHNKLLAACRLTLGLLALLEQQYRQMLTS